MTETGFTTRTWRVEESDLHLLSIPVDHDLVITRTKRPYTVGLTPEEARLIAAAPELYQSVQDAAKLIRELGYKPTPDSILLECQQALAKAEGKAVPHA